VSEPEPSLPFDAAAYRVALPAFEGPLDLLLHLIQKHELNIFDIPISFITTKYLEYIRVLQVLDLDQAGEYLLMAATLAHIKSRDLLPTPPTEDLTLEGIDAFEEDPRAALVRRLLEYQKFKAAAEDLASRGVAGRDVFFRGTDLANADEQTAPLAALPMYALIDALQRIATKKRISLAHEVMAERVSISERINELIDQLRGPRSAAFEDLFARDVSTADIVVTFLAILEMTRMNITKLYQAGAAEPIHITLLLSDDQSPPPLSNVG